MALTRIADELAERLGMLRFGPPVTHVYNPLIYARKTHHAYLRRYGSERREIVLIGMNPGPWGMAQTGVPFGEVSVVRDWLGIAGAVDKPEQEHPRRPVEGFQCRRSEISGSRLWGWARNRFGTPARFFDRMFVANYCPLMFMESSGRNRTPDKLPAAERDPLLSACDHALVQTIRRLRPRYVIGIGGFAAARAAAALTGHDVTTGRILHPSPASPAANRDWAAKITVQMEDLGISLARRSVDAR
jgi:single-strand selective monofunctional uracil DNA glycosylase